MGSMWSGGKIKIKRKKKKKKENTVGSYKCNCPSGYIQKPEANNQCQGMMSHLKTYL